MSWVSENKFLTGFGAVMLVGVGTLGYFTYAAMDKYDAATSGYDTAAGQLKKLQDTKPALRDTNLKELLAQKQELTEKIGAFQQELKSRVLPIEPITKQAFQDKLKESVAQITAKATAANVERPKDFYLGFGEYQSRPPDDKATPALARELRAIELIMGALIKTGGLELEELHRDPLAEEGGGGPGKRRGGDRASGGVIERNGVRLKFTSDDRALREVLAILANHKQQLFVIRNVSVQNKVAESPARVGAAGPASAVPAVASAPVPADGSAPAAPAVPAAPATPAPPAPEPAAAAGNEGPLSYVFGTEKITSTIDLEILNIEEPKASSEKPEKGAKKKEK